MPLLYGHLKRVIGGVRTRLTRDSCCVGKPDPSWISGGMLRVRNAQRALHKPRNYRGRDETPPANEAITERFDDRLDPAGNHLKILIDLNR